jgi:hypothetical protein
MSDVMRALCGVVGADWRAPARVGGASPVTPRKGLASAGPPPLAVCTEERAEASCTQEKKFRSSDPDPVVSRTFPDPDFTARILTFPN